MRDDARFDARGDAPRWALSIAEGAIALRSPGEGGKDRHSGRIDKVEPAPAGMRISAALFFDDAHPVGLQARDGRPLLSVETSEEPMTIEVIEAPCLAKRRTYPTRVVITLFGEARYRGCGGSLAALEAAVTRPR